MKNNQRIGEFSNKSSNLGRKKLKQLFLHFVEVCYKESDNQNPSAMAPESSKLNARPNNVTGEL